MTKKAGASMAMSTTGLQRPYKTVSTTMKRSLIGLQIPVVQIATSSQLWSPSCYSSLAREECKVERTCEYCENEGVREFRVKWRGYTSEDDTQEELANQCRIDTTWRDTS
jgi:hypothetical protein